MNTIDLAGLAGLYVGQLDANELEAFNAACLAGTAQRVYEGAGGFLGLAKVRIVFGLATGACGTFLLGWALA